MSLKLLIQKMIPNMVAHYIDDEEIWVSSNYTLYTSQDEGITFNKVVDLEVAFLMQMLGRSRLFTRALRLGIRSLKKLNNGTILAIADRKIFRLKDGQCEIVHSFKNGFGPLREGWCEDEKGNCYMGEYFLNNKRNRPVKLLKSIDDGRSWQIIHSFNNIRHIHSVQYDSFEKKIYMGTGDRDKESSISFSEDEGETWTELGSGDQMFRAVSLLFTKDHIYWGSDSPTIQNYIYRYVRQSGEIEKLVAVDGPIYYSTILGNGIKLFATTAEGDSEGKSAEWDNKAHIWASQDGVQWEDIKSWEKDFLPYILGHGRILFADGNCGNDDLYITTEALKNVDGMLMHCKILI